MLCQSHTLTLMMEVRNCELIEQQICHRHNVFPTQLITYLPSLLPETGDREHGHPGTDEEQL